MTKTYIIAEMACSHEGQLNLGRKIIDAAGSAGADAIQFQVWEAEHTAVPQHADMAVLKKIELGPQKWRDLAVYVRERYPALDIIACVYDTDAVDFCETLAVDAYKLHTADLSNPVLLEKVRGTGKRVDLSIGASTIAEIEKAIDTLQSGEGTDIWLMYGYQLFPTPVECLRMNYMLKLRDLFELPMGYQDHSDADTPAAFWMPAAALGAGIRIIEKHITHDRSIKGIDHQAALNPDEFSDFVQMVREIEAARGSGTPGRFSDEEERYRKYSKKSIVAGRTLKAGHVVHAEDILFLRANDIGLPPDRAADINGRRTTRDIPAYELILEKDLTSPEK